MAVSPLNAFVYFFKSYSHDGAYRIREIFVYNGFADSDSLKYLCRLVRLEGGYAHFRRYFYDSVEDSVVVVLDCGVVILVEPSAFYE